MVTSLKGHPLNPYKRNLFVKPDGNPFYCVDTRAWSKKASEYSKQFFESPKARFLATRPRFGCTGPVHGLKYVIHK